MVVIRNARKNRFLVFDDVLVAGEEIIERLPNDLRLADLGDLANFLQLLVLVVSDFVRHRYVLHQ
jgi:hypothetical protein